MSRCFRVKDTLLLMLVVASCADKPNNTNNSSNEKDKELLERMGGSQTKLKEFKNVNIDNLLKSDNRWVYDDWYLCSSVIKATDKNKNADAINNVLQELISGDRIKVIKILIEEGYWGIDEKVKNEDQDTLLSLASYYGALDVMEYLIDKGADPKYIEKAGNTILHLASRPEIIELIQKKMPNLCNTLIEIQNNNGMSPLLQQILDRHSACAIKLIDMGANIHCKVGNDCHLIIDRANLYDICGDSILKLAEVSGLNDVVDALKDKEAEEETINQEEEINHHEEEGVNETQVEGEEEREEEKEECVNENQLDNEEGED